MSKYDLFIHSQTSIRAFLLPKSISDRSLIPCILNGHVRMTSAWCTATGNLLENCNFQAIWQKQTRAKIRTAVDIRGTNTCTGETTMRSCENTPKDHPADTYSRITREIHVFSVSKWCLFSGNTPCISRVIHEYQPKLHVLHEISLHRNGAMMEKSRWIAKFLIHNYPTWTRTTRGAIWCIWCTARGKGVRGVEEVYVE